METGAGVPGYSGGLAASPNVFFGMRITGFVLADEDVSAPGPIMETGAIVPGYSGGLAACVVVLSSELGLRACWWTGPADYFCTL
jgi:hypothetical protein